MPSIVFSRPSELDFEAFTRNTEDAVKDFVPWTKLNNPNYFSVIRLISIQTGTYLNALYSVVLATRGALAVTEDMVALAEAMPLEQNADLREFFLQMLRIAEDARAKADSGCETLKNVQKDIERLVADVNLEFDKPKPTEEEATLGRLVPIKLEETAGIAHRLSESTAQLADWWSWITIPVEGVVSEDDSLSAQVESLADKETVESFRRLRKGFEHYLEQIDKLKELDPNIPMSLPLPRTVESAPQGDSKPTEVVDMPKQRVRLALKTLTTPESSLDSPLSPYTIITSSPLEGYKDDGDRLMPGGFGQIATYWPSLSRREPRISMIQRPEPFVGLSRGSTPSLSSDGIFPGALQEAFDEAIASRPSEHGSQAVTPFLASIFSVCTSTALAGRTQLAQLAHILPVPSFSRHDQPAPSSEKNDDLAKSSAAPELIVTSTSSAPADQSPPVTNSSWLWYTLSLALAVISTLYSAAAVATSVTSPTIEAPPASLAGAKDDGETSDAKAPQVVLDPSPSITQASSRTSVSDSGVKDLEPKEQPTASDDPKGKRRALTVTVNQPTTQPSVHFDAQAAASKARPSRPASQAFSKPVVPRASVQRFQISPPLAPKRRNDTKPPTTRYAIDSSKSAILSKLPIGANGVASGSQTRNGPYLQSAGPSSTPEPQEGARTSIRSQTPPPPASRAAYTPASRSSVSLDLQNIPADKDVVFDATPLPQVAIRAAPEATRPAPPPPPVTQAITKPVEQATVPAPVTSLVPPPSTSVPQATASAVKAAAEVEAPVSLQPSGAAAVQAVNPTVSEEKEQAATIPSMSDVPDPVVAVPATTPAAPSWQPPSTASRQGSTVHLPLDENTTGGAKLGKKGTWLDKVIGKRKHRRDASGSVGESSLFQELLPRRSTDSLRSDTSSVVIILDSQGKTTSEKVPREVNESSPERKNILKSGFMGRSKGRSGSVGGEDAAGTASKRSMFGSVKVPKAK